jgi:hypothetical protein
LALKKTPFSARFPAKNGTGLICAILLIHAFELVDRSILSSGRPAPRT